MKSIIQLVAGTLSGMWYAFVAYKVYWWFAVPLGAPHIGYIVAWGLYNMVSALLLWGIIVPSELMPKHSDKYDLSFALVAKAVTAGGILLESWILHQFV